MKHVLLLYAVVTFAADAYGACGTQGGPGYRKPDGKCVSWAELGRACGNPPTTRCTAEVTNPNAPAAAEKGQAIQSFMSNAHQGS